MTGSMRTFVTDGRTDGRTEREDGGNFKGPKCWSKNSHKHLGLARPGFKWIEDGTTQGDIRLLVK